MNSLAQTSTRIEPTTKGGQHNWVLPLGTLAIVLGIGVLAIKARMSPQLLAVLLLVLGPNLSTDGLTRRTQSRLSWAQDPYLRAGHC
jgi:hypothetical protein